MVGLLQGGEVSTTNYTPNLGPPGPDVWRVPRQRPAGRDRGPDPDPVLGRRRRQAALEDRDRRQSRRDVERPAEEGLRGRERGERTGRPGRDLRRGRRGGRRDRGRRRAARRGRGRGRRGLIAVPGSERFLGPAAAPPPAAG